MTAIDFIGDTPIVRLGKIEKTLGDRVRIYAKLEFLNPFGSIKDRAAKQIILDAEKKRRIDKDIGIIEATSGNMGISLAAICAHKDYPCTIVMPENMSESKQKLIRAYGAELILTSAPRGMLGAVKKANEIAENNINTYYPKQFENYSSVKAHKKTTAKEIYFQANQNCGIVIAGIGTGGTISGIGQFFKSICANTEIIGVEPAASPYLTQHRSGEHGIQGIGAGFMPKLLDLSVIDRVITVTDEEAIEACRLLSVKEGIFAGPSSGAVLAACYKLAKFPENQNKTAALIFADSGERYL